MSLMKEIRFCIVKKKNQRNKNDTIYGVILNLWTQFLLVKCIPTTVTSELKSHIQIKKNTK